MLVCWLDCLRDVDHQAIKGRNFRLCREIYRLYESNADVGDYTIRVFNGASDCFTDVVVTLNMQVCTAYDWGDLPDLSSGTGQGNYETSAANNGPSHQIIDGLHLGPDVDAETDGLSSSDTLGDGADENGQLN